MRWWGWGDPDHPAVLPEHAVAFLHGREKLAELDVHALVSYDDG